jgi:hypothetical protein
MAIVNCTLTCKRRANAGDGPTVGRSAVIVDTT